LRIKNKGEALKGIYLIKAGEAVGKERVLKGGRRPVLAAQKDGRVANGITHFQDKKKGPKTVPEKLGHRKKKMKRGGKKGKKGRKNIVSEDKGRL